MSAKIWNLIEMIVRAIFGFIFRLFKIDFTEEQWQALFQFVKFGLVGVWNTILNLVIVALVLFALKAMGVDKGTLLGHEVPLALYIANTVGFIISVFSSFMLNSRLVFKVGEGESRSFWKALLRTYMAYGFTGLILNNVLNTVWVNVCHLPDMAAMMISLVIAIPINFLMNKLWAFKTENSK